MEAQELAAEKKRRPGWVRAVAWLAFAGGLAVIAMSAAFVGVYLGCPVAPPPTAPVSSWTSVPSLALASTPSTTTSTSKFIVNVTLLASGSTATLRVAPTAAVGGQPRAHDEKTVYELVAEVTHYELVAEATQPTAKLKAKAREINESFARLGVEFEDYMVKKGKRTDPDQMTGEECVAFLHVHGRVSSIRVGLETSFGVAAVERFDRVYLGMMVEHKDWYDAAIFCAEHRKNWSEALYCCRQMNSWEGGLMFAGMGVNKILTGSADLDFD